MKILLAGATGLVGFEVLKLLHARGHEVRTLSRDPRRAERLRTLAADVRVVDATAQGSLTGACDDIEVVVSTLGAPVAQQAKERRSFAAIDIAANLALLEEARRAGVRRFVYLSAAQDAATVNTAYIRAHTTVEDALRRSSLSSTSLRPTGIFGAFAELLQMARRGPLPIIGDGAATTNPIHERDVAEAIIDVLAQGPEVVELGGPDVLSRREIATEVFSALRTRPRFVAIPAWLMSTIAVVIGVFNRRSADFLKFIVAASTHSALAPKAGARRLQDYLAAIASTGRL